MLHTTTRMPLSPNSAGGMEIGSHNGFASATVKVHGVDGVDGISSVDSTLQIGNGANNVWMSWFRHEKGECKNFRLKM